MIHEVLVRDGVAVSVLPVGYANFIDRSDCRALRVTAATAEALNALGWPRPDPAAAGMLTAADIAVDVEHRLAETNGRYRDLLLPDTPQAPGELDAMVAYRAALRAVVAQPDPNAVVWPEPPGGPA